MSCFGYIQLNVLLQYRMIQGSVTTEEIHYKCGGTETTHGKISVSWLESCLQMFAQTYSFSECTVPIHKRNEEYTKVILEIKRCKHSAVSYSFKNSFHIEIKIGVSGTPSRVE